MCFTAFRSVGRSLDLAVTFRCNVFESLSQCQSAYDIYLHNYDLAVAYRSVALYFRAFHSVSQRTPATRVARAVTVPVLSAAFTDTSS